MPKPAVRRQDQYVPLSKEQFRERFFARFYDPAFEEVHAELEKVFEKAWDGYIVYRKSPRTKPAGKGFADPKYPVAVEWLETRAKIQAAEKRQKDPKSPSRILVINGSTRSEHTCPGEISKTRVSRSTRRRRSNHCPATKRISSTSRRSPTSRGK